MNNLPKKQVKVIIDLSLIHEPWINFMTNMIGKKTNFITLCLKIK